MKKLPLHKLSDVYHIGTLDIREKKELNFEGTNGLSVSTDAEAWCRINRGMTYGNKFHLHNDNGTFIAGDKIDNNLFSELLQWGEENGYLIPCQQYCFSYHDEEMDENISFYFDSKDEADAESEGDHPVHLVSTYKGTDRLASIVGEINKDNLSLITVAYCIIETQYDGVYWDCETDILRYQAPRGVIVQNRLTNWNLTNLSIDK